MRLILDLNAMLNAALLRGIDHEFGRTVEFEGKSVKVNSHQYGIDNFGQDLADTLEHFDLPPRKVIGVWDGKDSKAFRQVHLPQYKAGRERAPEIAQELGKARELVTEMLRALGAQVVVNEGREADDVIAYLCQKLVGEVNTVVTVDGDLCVLSDHNTHVYCNREMDVNPYGPFPHKFITLYKALVGDTSDKIPGAKGFGDAAWCELVRTFGVEGLDEFVRLIETNQLHELQESVLHMPKLKVVLENMDMVYVSWRVAKLHPGAINGLRNPLTWKPGMVQAWGDLDPLARVDRLKNHYGTKTLVTAENYEQVANHFTQAVSDSTFVALDIETASGVDSDMWLMNVKKRDPDSGKIDVLGHELVGMSLTFGNNHQHTIYMAVNHVEQPRATNITVDQCREMVEKIPAHAETVIQSRQFEFSVLYRTWGDKWADNGWHGFVPNAVDTAIGASYVNENLPRGLKFLSKHYLDYDQQTYEQVTTVDGERHKMDELTAAQVLNYGCDDTICTSALHNHFLTIMEMEGSLNAYYEVETLPQYLTSLAFVQGVRISLARLNAIEAEDDIKHAAAWKVLRDFLISKGWVGTQMPVWDEVTLQGVKDAVLMVTGQPFTSRKRKPDAVALELLEAFPDNAYVNLLAEALRQGQVGVLNNVIKKHFDGEPKINLDSPVQVQNLLYRVIGITPRVHNPMTEKERQDPDFSASYAKLSRYKKNPDKVEVTEDDRTVWIKKASTDDTAVELALYTDELTPDSRAALEALAAIKTINTRRKLFYTPYKSATHWRDDLVHSSIQQCGAVTRRYSSSDPNLQQLPARGEGIKFRTILLGHKSDEETVVVSFDISGQELRLLAEASGDEAMRSCYVGDNKRDIHSLIAVEAAPHLWKRSVSYEEFMAMRRSDDPAVRDEADELRDKAKTTNFASGYGAGAPKIALQLKTSEEIAQRFLDAKDRAFPGVNIWKRKVSQEAAERGYSTTFMGARRHLADAFNSGQNWEVMRGERQASNAEIQSSGAEMAKLAMSRMWESGIFTGRYDAQMIAPIHDEIVASVAKSQLAAFIKEAHALMVMPYAHMTIPVVSSIAIGWDFSCPVSIGDIPSDEAIAKGLAALEVMKEERSPAKPNLRLEAVST